MMLRSSAPFLAAAAIVLTGCGSSERTRAIGTPQRDTVVSTGDASTRVDSSAQASKAAPPSASATPVRGAKGDMPSSKAADRPIVRALYVNRFAAQSSKRMHQLIDVADHTEINALVIDAKDEFGLNFNSSNAEFAKNAGTTGKIRDVKALTDTLLAHDILPIARIVVFKDSVTARVHPEWTIRKNDGSIWRDKKGLAWVNPYHRELWNYNIGIAEELVKLGFKEIQFDYIRFPEPYKSLPPQVFSESNGQSKPDAIAEFLKTARDRLHKLDTRVTADIFGLVTTVGGPLEVAQHWERLSPVTDVLLPMVYPSHYPPGSFGLAHPNAEPYKIVNYAISRARERDEKLGLPKSEHVRPYLQAFTLGKPPYEAEQLRQQKQAVYDAGYDGWVLWNPGSKYEAFESAFEKTLESRKKASPTAAPKVE